MKRSLSPVLFVLFIAVLFSGCSKSGSNPSPKNTGSKVTVASLSTSTGPYTTIVTITGTGFSTAAANNQVTFNGHTAIVQAASSTQLLTTVPLAAGTGAVTVTINGTTATGPIFTYQVAQVVTPFAGSGHSGSADGKGAAATFNQPNGLATDAAGNVYVADQENNLIRKITPDGTVSTLAGSGQSGHDDGTGVTASFNNPQGVATDAAGNVFVADSYNYLIRKITSSGVVSTIAGNSSSQPANGQGTAASFSRPSDVVVDGSGNIFVADQGAGQIRKITSAGLVSTVYSSGDLNPYQLAVDKLGNIYAPDPTDNDIKKISQSGVLTRFAGNGNIIGGDIDGTGTGAAFYQPIGIAIDGNGNLFVVDKYNGLIREITPAAVVTTVGGRGATNPYGPVAHAILFGVQGIAVDTGGNIYFTSDNEIRKISMQ